LTRDYTPWRTHRVSQSTLGPINWSWKREGTGQPIVRYPIVRSDSSSSQRQMGTFVPSNLLISSGGHNFVTPAANFFDLLKGLFHEISKFFKKKLPFKYYYLLMLFGAKKRLIWRFLKISILLDFVTKLIFKTSKNVLENTNKEAS
jgi:hypothetical protein